MNKKLEILHFSNNKLASLHLNDNLKILFCHHNKLTSLQLNKKLQYLSCSNNPICEIINSNENTINQLKILNQFRYLYYSLKFKKRFRDLLWVKIREPKIKIKYSHDYLIANLHEDTDLDTVLNNW